MDVLEQIKIIIGDCEDIQWSNESDYTKIQAMITAYENIKELFKPKIPQD